MATWAAVLGSAFALAACGSKSSSNSGGNSSSTPAGGGATTSTSSSTASSSSADPCTLLTKAEVEGALGGPSKPPKKNESPGGGAVKVCSWFPVSGSPIRFVQVSLSRFPTSSGKAQFDGLKKLAPGAKDVSGIGEAAFVSKFGPDSKVSVLKGETVLGVTSPDAAGATKLAKAALGRM